MKDTYGKGKEKGKHLLEEIIETVRVAGRHSPYDCIIGVSGPPDSSYLLMQGKRLGAEALGGSQ